MKKLNDDCVFCKIVAGELPSKKLYEDDHTVAFLSINPERDGHALVVPKKHIRNIRDCDAETMAQLLHTIQKISANMRAFKIIQNNEKPIQEVFHLHFHVIPC